MQFSKIELRILELVLSEGRYEGRHRELMGSPIAADLHKKIHDLRSSTENLTEQASRLSTYPTRVHAIISELRDALDKHEWQDAEALQFLRNAATPLQSPDSELLEFLAEARDAPGPYSLVLPADWDQYAREAEADGEIFLGLELNGQVRRSVRFIAENRLAQILADHRAPGGSALNLIDVVVVDRITEDDLREAVARLRS